MRLVIIASLDCREEVLGGDFAVDEAGVDAFGQPVGGDKGEYGSGGEPFIFYERLTSFAQLCRIVFCYVVAACREFPVFRTF